MSFLHTLQPASPPAAGLRRKLVPAALAMPLLMAACGGGNGDASAQPLTPAAACATVTCWRIP